MKKVLSLVLAFVMVFALVACGGGSSDSGSNTAAPAATDSGSAPAATDAAKPARAAMARCAA